MSKRRRWMWRGVLGVSMVLGAGVGVLWYWGDHGRVMGVERREAADSPVESWERRYWFGFDSGRVGGGITWYHVQCAVRKTLAAEAVVQWSAISGGGMGGTMAFIVTRHTTGR